MRLRNLLPFIMLFSLIIMFISSAIIILLSSYIDSFLWLDMEKFASICINFAFIFTLCALIYFALHHKKLLAYAQNFDMVLLKKRALVSFFIVLVLFVIFIDIPFSSSLNGLFSNGPIDAAMLNEQTLNVEQKDSSLESQESNASNETEPKVLTDEQIYALNLKELEELYGIDLKKCIRLLKIKGIHFVNEKSILKNIAKDLQMSPKELLRMLKYQ